MIMVERAEREELGAAGAVSVAALLARGLGLPDPDRAPEAVPPGTRCAIGGEPLLVRDADGSVRWEGYPVRDLVTGATAEFLDTYRGEMHGHVSRDAAACLRSANPRAGNPCARSHLAFDDGTYFGPLINRDSALAQGRPCWRDLVRAVWHGPDARRGQRCVVVVTTDTKKRLWPRARVGQLGQSTAVYLHDSGLDVSGVRMVSWVELLRCLDDVEEVYRAGFGKASIGATLWRDPAFAAVGVAATRAYESLIAPWRARPEFAMALLIAQRADEGRAPGGDNGADQRQARDKGADQADERQGSRPETSQRQGGR